MAERVDGSTLVARTLQRLRVGYVFVLVAGPCVEAVGACAHLGVRPHRYAP